MGQPFTSDVIAAVSRHMNDDHAADSLLIVRALGGRPGATTAVMTGMDGEGIDFESIVDGDSVAVRVPFARPLTTRAEVRPEVVRLYQEACAVLGLTPRP